MLHMEKCSDDNESDDGDGPDTPHYLTTEVRDLKLYLRSVRRHSIKSAECIR